MTNYSEIITDRLAETVASHDHPKATIEDLSEVVATQAAENRQLNAENRILWDLLLFDRPDAERFEVDDSSKLEETVGTSHKSKA
jgi:hypothetical protein